MTNQKQENNFNGWQNIGKITQWVLQDTNLTHGELRIYICLVQRTLGYSQYTSNFLSYEKIASLAGTSLGGVKKIIPSLLKKKYIIKIQTNKLTSTGKLPYKYQLNMKLNNFPHLGKLLTAQEVEERFIKSKNIQPLKPEKLKISLNDALQMLNSLDNRDITRLQQTITHNLGEHRYTDKILLPYLTNKDNYEALLIKIEDEAYLENKHKGNLK